MIIFYDYLTTLCLIILKTSLKNNFILNIKISLYFKNKYII
jgi:hypothetical protein